MIKRKDSSSMVQAAIRKLSSETNINYFGSGSVARTIIEAIAREIELLYDSIDLNLSQARLSTASGVFLDLIAQQFGLTRQGGTSSSILAEDRVMRFYTNFGRLIDNLPGSSPTTGVIPSGTRITNRNGSVVYTVPSDITFPASATSVFVPITPADDTAGTANNVPAGSLTVHNLPSNKILCENISGIVTGSDPESDSELRLRISRFVNSKVTGSKSSVIEAAFSFPGVSDIKIHNYKFGAGSFEVLAVPVSSSLSPNISENIRAAIDAIVPYGIRFSVRGPDVVYISLVMQISMDKGSLPIDKAAAIIAVQNSLRQYIGSIAMGSEFIVSRATSIALSAHPGIKDVRLIQLAINCKPQVIANYRLREDEVFDLDKDISNPLLVIG